jgi:hypothetical protein
LAPRRPKRNAFIFARLFFALKAEVKRNSLLKPAQVAFQGLLSGGSAVEPFLSSVVSFLDLPRATTGRPGGSTTKSTAAFFSFSADAGHEEVIMNNGLLALTAAGLASVGGFGITAKTSPVQTAQVVTTSPDYSEQAGVFSQWLDPQAPQCVAVSKIGAVSSLKKLTPEQFQFVRALYVAIPPISRALPPGDSAVIASASGRSMIALVSGGEACARFLAPDFVLSMLTQVGKGETVAAGDPI